MHMMIDITSDTLGAQLADELALALERLKMKVTPVRWEVGAHWDTARKKRSPLRVFSRVSMMVRAQICIHRPYHDIVVAANTCFSTACCVLYNYASTRAVSFTAKSFG